MTPEDIYEFFKDDSDLLLYFDPLSCAKNNLEASIEIYSRLMKDHAEKGGCVFKRTESWFIFYKKTKWYQRNILISFCVKPEHRNKDNLEAFGYFIKREVGNHFNCYLYNNNTRAIRFLQKIGMNIVKSNNLITLLSI
jgi:hypothetical protein